MINKIFLISFDKLVLFWLVIYILVVLINYKNMQDKKKFKNIEEIKNDRLLAQTYIDQFYITNKFYTFFMTFIYIFGIVLIFIFIRYLSINNFMIISTQESLHNVLISLFTIYLIIFITIILYKSLLTVLCEKEVNKFFIYINQYSWVDKLYYISECKLGDKIFGPLYLIIYRISTLEYKYPFYGREFEVAHKFIINDEPDYIIDNQIVVNYAYLATNYVRRYAIVQKFFRILAYIFRFCYKHIQKINELFPYFILSLTFIIELYHREFHYIYIMLFIFLLIKFKRDFVKFKSNRNASYDWYISVYFYKNDVSYEKQRIYFYSKDNMNISKSFNSRCNSDLFLRLKEIVEYTFNDFKDTYEPSLGVKQGKRRNKSIYRRFYVILGFVIISYYLLLINWLTILFLFPLLIMIYTHRKTYYVFIYDEKISYEEYKYNKKYNILFWIFTIIQGYIFWVVLLKPELIFMDTEVLINIPYIAEITRIYSIEEKIMYLYNYFEYIINLIEDKVIDKDYLRFIIREIDFKDLIDNTVSLKDIKVYIKLLIDNYYLNNITYEMLAEYMNKKILEENNMNPWYILLRNVLLIGVTTSTTVYYKNILLIMKQINNPIGINKMINEIYSGTIKEKLTYEMFVNIMMKIFKW